MKTIIYCASWERGEEQFNKYIDMYEFDKRYQNDICFIN